VTCYKLDRFSRSTRDFVDQWEVMAAHGVEFTSLCEQFDTSTAMGKAMLSIAMVFAQLESEMIGERTRATMLDRASRGLWNGGVVYGYVADDEGRLRIDDEWAATIRRHVFDAFEDLGSVGATARRLRELGIYVPERETEFGKKIGGKPFDARQVMTMLTNRTYLGEVRWGDAECLDAHEPLISKVQFDRVQRKLGHNRRTRTNYNQRKQHGYLLAGLVRCGGCGSMMTACHATGRNRKYPYYQCTRRQHGEKADCDAPYIPADLLDKAVVERCIALSADEQSRDRIVRQAIEKADDVGRRLDGEIDAVRHRIARTTSDISNLMGVLKNLGAEGLASVGEELKRLEREREALHAEAKSLGEQRTEAQGVNERAEAFLDSWKSVAQLFEHATPEEQRALIRLYVEVIEIRATDDKGKEGTYSLVLFPEAVGNRVDPAAENARHNDHDPAEAGPMLRDGGLVLSNPQEAPRTQPCSEHSHVPRGCGREADVHFAHIVAHRRHRQKLRLRCHYATLDPSGSRVHPRREPPPSMTDSAISSRSSNRNSFASGPGISLGTGAASS